MTTDEEPTNPRTPERTAAPRLPWLLRLIPLRRLRTSMLLLVAAAVIPALVILLTNAARARAKAEHDARADAGAAARTVAVEYERIVARAHSLLSTLSRLPEIRGGDSRQCGALLADVDRMYPIFDGLGVTNEEGVRVCSSALDAQPLDLSDRSYVRQALSSGAFTVGEYQIGRDTSRALVAFAHPVASEDADVGRVVYAMLELRRLPGLVQDGVLPEGSVVRVLDTAGVLLAQLPSDSPGTVGEPDPRVVSWLPVMTEGIHLNVDGHDGDGVERMHTALLVRAPQGTGGLIVDVALPLAGVTAAADAARRQSLIWIGLVLLLALVVGWFVSGVLVVRPVRELISDTRRLAQGELPLPARHTEWPGEVGDLARAFDDMGESLRDYRAAHRATLSELRESERFKDAALEATQDGIVWITAQGEIRTASPAAESTFGSDAKGLEGRRLLDELLEQDAAAGVRAAVLELPAARSGELVLRRVQGGARRIDGSPFPIEMHVAALPGGTEPEFTIYIRDLTGQRQLEEQFLRAQRMEAVARFAGGIAHDFNNNLAVIIGYAQLVLPTLSDAQSDTRDAIEKMFLAAQRASVLTRQILGFSRRGVRDAVVLELNRELEETIGLARSLLGARVDCAADLRADAGQVRADPSQLEQIVMNLIVNARDAMPDGGTLTVSSRAAAVDPEFAKTRPDVDLSDYALIAVSDTGTGMDAEVRRRIFDPFFTTKERGRGTGLGLATCQAIVKQCGGFMRVLSELGEGSTFEVYLPRVDEPPSPLPSRPTGPTLAPGSGHVLVVEDDPFVRDLMQAVLQRAGYTPVCVHTAELALGYIRENPEQVDLVLSDAILPQRTGIDLARTLADGPTEIPFILTSADLESEVVGAAEAGTYDVFLPKPFTPAELAYTVQAVLEGRSPRRSAE